MPKSTNALCNYNEMEEQPKPLKYCRICGDRANCFNYNGLSCESCKVFFLRNANKKLECLKFSNCEINTVTRKNCPKCRLDKCFANQMCALMVRSTIKSREATDVKHCWLDSAIKQTVLDCSALDDEHQLGDDIQPKQIRNVQLYDEPDPFDLNLPSLRYIGSNSSTKGCDFELMASERQSIVNLHSMLDEHFVDESKVRVIGIVSAVADSMPLTALYARRITRFCKSIPAFRELCQSDQIVLLKPFFIEVLSIRFMYMYDRVRDGYPILENETGTQALLIRTDLSLQIKNQKSAQKTIQFCMSIFEALEGDFTIRDLLISILLFKPRSSKLKNLESVCYQYCTYTRLLRRYLAHKYGDIGQANRKYQALMQTIDGFDHQSRLMCSVVQQEYDFTSIPPLLIEVFDLCPQFPNHEDVKTH